MKVIDKIGKFTMSYDYKFKETEIYASCNECRCRKCDAIKEKDRDDLLNSLCSHIICIVECRKNTKNVNHKVFKISNGRTVKIRCL